MAHEGGTERLSLDSFANKVLTSIRKAAFGAKGAMGKRELTPFSLATVVRGSGVDPKVAVSEGSNVYRALEAMVSWSLTWRQDELPELVKAALPIRTQPSCPSGHILYARKRGRAVWYPGLFTCQSGDFRSLSCYHRNILLASLQVESLGGFMRETAEMIKGAKNYLNPIAIVQGRPLVYWAGCMVVKERIEAGASKPTLNKTTLSSQPTKCASSSAWIPCPSMRRCV